MNIHEMVFIIYSIGMLIFNLITVGIAVYEFLHRKK